MNTLLFEGLGHLIVDGIWWAGTIAILVFSLWVIGARERPGDEPDGRA